MRKVVLIAAMYKLLPILNTVIGQVPWQPNCVPTAAKA